jgi:hypothetical protein
MKLTISSRLFLAVSFLAVSYIETLNSVVSSSCVLCSSTSRTWNGIRRWNYRLDGRCCVPVLIIKLEPIVPTKCFSRSHVTLWLFCFECTCKSHVIQFFNNTVCFMLLSNFTYGIEILEKWTSLVVHSSHVDIWRHKFSTI